MTEIEDNKLKTSITNLSHEGRGVSKYNQKTLFIDNALPNECVTFEYRKKHRRYDEAKALEILNPSPDRVQAKCAHFMVCGGCSLQHLESKAQIKWKEKLLLEQLDHFGHVQPQTVFPPITGLSFHYREKARLGVRYVTKKEKQLVGFHEKNSNKVAEIDSCEILHPGVAALISPLKNLIRNLSVFQAIPQIEVAVAEEGVALVFRLMQTPIDSDRLDLIEFGKEYGILIFLQEKGPDSIELLYSPNSSENSHALLHYSLPKYNIKFGFSPLDFTQVNQAMNQQMVDRVIELLEPNSTDILLDLFCGLGNFTLPLARFSKKVVGIEGNEKMVKRAQLNAELNGLSNTEFFAANLYDENLCGENNALSNLLVGQHLNQFNKILLDPPRSGALPLMPLLCKLETITHIVYVSCNPASFARDLGILVQTGGYTLKGVQVLDMFPQTTHVESLAILKRE